ncbi:MAG: twin-arginine translocase subunit TatC [Prevotellaceae bacterium]|nr:twin-arginine translocase subunit TatC [Prevotellaceae bacterium]
MGKSDGGMMTFGGHLEALRKMLIRMVIVTLVLAVAIFCFKDEAFRLLLAPGSSDFVTYRTLERLCASVGWSLHIEPFRIELINTELSNQFLVHVSTSVYLALLLASPYVVLELYAFVAPALYESERRYSVPVALAVYVLFLLGVLMSYYILFPFALRFLGTYQVSASVVNQINLSSYISTFTTLTLLMGLVFQIPVLSLLLSRLGVLESGFMRHYRRHALILVMLVAAVITPPDIFTLLIVSLPMYALYELSIIIVRLRERRG